MTRNGIRRIGGVVGGFALLAKVYAFSEVPVLYSTQSIASTFGMGAVMGYVFTAFLLLIRSIFYPENLCTAVTQNYIARVRYLLDEKQSPNIKCHDGRTPLQIATDQGFQQRVSLIKKTNDRTHEH